MRRQRSAFTLVEMVVVVAIVAFLAALVVPAVQRVREAAARTQCANNLKQIGLAAHHYHDTKRRLPAGMRWQNGKDAYRMAGWLTFLLPYLEQQGLWEKTEQAFRETREFTSDPPHVGLSKVMAVFACPADARTGVPQFVQRERRRVALCSYLGVEGRDLNTQDGVLFRDSRIRMGDITDGTSNTLLAGERPPSTDFRYGWWYAGTGQRFSGSLDTVLGVCEQNTMPVTPGSCGPGTCTFGPGRFDNQCDMFHFWSPHSGGGAQFLFADGCVRFLTYEVAPLLPGLASRAGGEPGTPL